MSHKETYTRVKTFDSKEAMHRWINNEEVRVVKVDDLTLYYEETEEVSDLSPMNHAGFSGMV